MAMYEIPRNTKGEGKILYIFSTKALIYTVVGILVGFIFKAILGIFGSLIPGISGLMNTIGYIIMALFALAGFAAGTFKVPKIDKFEFTRKAEGINIDTVIKEYIRFKIKKDKYYTYNSKEIIRQEIEKEQKDTEEILKKKEKERKEIR